MSGSRPHQNVSARAAGELEDIQAARRAYPGGRTFSARHRIPVSGGCLVARGQCVGRPTATPSVFQPRTVQQFAYTDARLALPARHEAPEHIS